MMCPGTFSSTSGLSSDPVRALCIGLPSGRGRTTECTKRQSGLRYFRPLRAFRVWGLAALGVHGAGSAERPCPAGAPKLRMRLEAPDPRLTRPAPLDGWERGLGAWPAGALRARAETSGPRHSRPTTLGAPRESGGCGAAGRAVQPKPSVNA